MSLLPTDIDRARDEIYAKWIDSEAKMQSEIERLRGRLAEEDRAADQLISERDHAEGMADKLAAALATMLDVDIGEHSSANCPWTEALEAFEERAPVQPSDALMQRAMGLILAIDENDPNDMAADGITLAQVWQKEAASILRSTADQQNGERS